MKVLYPSFQAHYEHEELVEYFYLQSDEIEFINRFRGDANRQVVAVLLKSLEHLGYFPSSLEEIPLQVRTFIAHQLNFLWDYSEEYAWDSGTRDRHLSEIREFLGWTFLTPDKRQALIQWVGEVAFQNVGDEGELRDAVYRYLKKEKIELLAENELLRLINSTWHECFQNLYQQIFSGLSAETQAKMDVLLTVRELESLTDFEKLKTSSAKPGVNNLVKEIKKLQILRKVQLTETSIINVPPKILRLLSRRARNEKAGEMRNHSPAVRYSLMVCFLKTRQAEIIDDIVQMFLLLLRKLDRQTEKQIEREILRDFKLVEGKNQILYRIAKAVIAEPNGAINEVIFPTVKEETFRDLVMEAESSGVKYEQKQIVFLKNKYLRHYRQALPLILDNLEFGSSNKHQPIVKALQLIKRYFGTSYQYFPEEVPLEVIPNAWKQPVLEKKDDEIKVNRKAYELCVLQKLEKALKCKEVWVVGAKTFRNPNDDLPNDWHNEPRWLEYYQSLAQPTTAEVFIESLKNRLTATLTSFNKTLPNNPSVKTYLPNQHSDGGLFALERLEAQPLPTNIEKLKEFVNDKYGVLDLLDVFLEADNLADFTKYFRHSGTKQVRSREQLRPLILLDLFAEGTNTGIKRISQANHFYKYDELLYVRKHYFSPEALRAANVAVVNKILELRNPHLWGKSNACASDGKRFESWQQNLLSEWRNRYKGNGILIYWHVQTNAICLYSQLRSFSSSEVAAMIEGLIRHDTEMRVEKNFVDSHGQSEVAFAFCKLLGFQLMPRLKRIKYEKLYLCEKGTEADFPNLKDVLSRPIRWQLIENQYDEMIKHAVALKLGTASAEAILRRFNSENKTHTTYKALIELGKVEKTIFLCEYLSDLKLRYEINEGLNVVERWNGVNDFIRYGKQGIFASNNREDQEISTLSLGLLQNCLMLINTLLVEQVIKEENFLEKLSVEDLRALSPLFYEHINPYGVFEIDVTRPSFLKREVA